MIYQKLAKEGHSQTLENISETAKWGFESKNEDTMEIKQQESEPKLKIDSIMKEERLVRDPSQGSVNS